MSKDKRLTIHDLKIEPQYFRAVSEGVKSFEIRKNDRNYKVGDLLLLREYDNGMYTGEEAVRQVTFITDYAQKSGFVVMSLKYVPISFSAYVNMSEKEKVVFEIMVQHLQLYGHETRAISNTLYEITKALIGDLELSGADKSWYSNYWGED